MTADHTYVPLRWIAPELVDEVHGNLLVAEASQESNIWYHRLLHPVIRHIKSHPHSHPTVSVSQGVKHIHTRIHGHNYANAHTCWQKLREVPSC